MPHSKNCSGVYAGSDNCPLFESARTERYSAMWMVGYIGSCCRSPTTGDANTPYNASCANSNAEGGNPALGVVGPGHTWLTEPLLFDLSVDVAQAHPLAKSDQNYATALAAVTAVFRTMNESLHDGKLASVANFKADIHTALCCNRTHAVCRCTELPSPAVVRFP